LVANNPPTSLQLIGAESREEEDEEMAAAEMGVNSFTADMAISRDVLSLESFRTNAPTFQ
jgi:hypothetical protein